MREHCPASIYPEDRMKYGCAFRRKGKCWELEKKESRAGCGGFKTTLSRCYAVAASFPAKERSRRPVCGRSSIRRGKIKLFGGFVQPGRTPGLVTRQGTVRNPSGQTTAQPGVPVSNVFGKCAQKCAVRMVSGKFSRQFHSINRITHQNCCFWSKRWEPA